MAKVLGLDLGTNSIGWALIEHDFANKIGEIEGLGTRIIPMDQSILGNFDAGVSISQTAERTHFRGVRRLYQRDHLRRERLHRVLQVLGFLPDHYSDSIDFKHKLGQFKKEVKLNYRKSETGKYEFIFKDSFHEMLNEFKASGVDGKIPYDWTLYYLRKKALNEKITKEELAWILLNFNQKRGYYQLRGEEEEKSSREEFHALKVVNVEATEDSNKNGTWYNVVLENNWVYRRQSKESLDNWLGKTKEFIVTTPFDKDGSLKKDKSGNIKRSFRAVDSEKDWVAIKKKTELDVENSKQFIGEFIYETLLKNPKQKIRGKLIKTIERKFYKEELKEILKIQIQFHHELKDKHLYRACIEELYPRNEAHQNNIKDKGFDYLFVDDIIFYQRPLKSKKSTISNCKLEKRFFIKDGIKEEQALKCCSKSNPIYQEFRLWQFVQNLKIYQKEKTVDGKAKLDVDVTNELFKTDEDWIKLFDFLNHRKEAEEKNIIHFLVENHYVDKQNKSNFRWNYVADKKYPMSESYASFFSRFSKVKNVDAQEFLSAENVQSLWHLIYSIKDKKEYEKALKSFAEKHELDVLSFVEAFKNYPPFKNDYGSYSEKAIKKLLPLMRLGKYWDDENVVEEAKETIRDINRRLQDIDFDEEKLNEVADDFIPKQLLKSFCSLKGRNLLKGLNTHQASYAVYKKYSESSDTKKWESPEDINNYLKEFKQHSLRNPIVEQVITETLRVVRDIWKYYGNSEANFFDEIHIELGRSMKNPAEKRKKMNARVTENENTNHRIKALLKELMNDDGIEGEIRPHSTSHQEILKIYEEGAVNNPEKNTSEKTISNIEAETIRKNSNPTKSDLIKYKLWLEQKYISPYTGKTIPLSKLFTSDYQIEHIIPQSRYFDNSLSNKVICESVVNQLKSNQTAYEFIKNPSGEKVDLGQNKVVELFDLERYEAHCKKHFRHDRIKLKNLLSEDIPTGFINRQLNDSRYISKLVKSLLSKIVKDENELEATSKNLIPVTGAITSVLKNDWGLNDKWNELIKNRFIRLNKLTQTENFGFWDKKINAFRIQVPDELSKGFSKKRIDHRHHALDALVIACCTRSHTHYLNSLNSEKENYALRNSLLKKSKKGDYTRNFLLPWDHFPSESKEKLEKIIVSFKQNTRVINKSNNKTWQWLKKDGRLKKELVKQTKGKNWAIRKALHKETVSGKLNWEAGKDKIVTATRTSLTAIKNKKQLEKITDSGIKKILERHLKEFNDNYELAFSSDGVEQLNKNIKELNNGKNHQAIYKVRLFEEGKKFAVSTNENNPKSSKFVEAAKGTNLFFAIYWNAKKGKRDYETIPLNEVIEHQKWRAKLSPKEMKNTALIPINKAKGDFLFSLSPNDLVYVPSDEEIQNPNLVDFNNLTRKQYSKIYKCVSSTGNRLYAIPNVVATPIQNKAEFTSLNKLEFDIAYGSSIKERCLKIEVDRLGSVSSLGAV